MFGMREYNKKWPIFHRSLQIAILKLASKNKVPKYLYHGLNNIEVDIQNTIVADAGNCGSGHG
jgi:hypothetical protein